MFVLFVYTIQKFTQASGLKTPVALIGPIPSN